MFCFSLLRRFLKVVSTPLICLALFFSLHSPGVHGQAPGPVSSRPNLNDASNREFRACFNGDARRKAERHFDLRVPRGVVIQEILLLRQPGEPFDASLWSLSAEHVARDPAAGAPDDKRRIVFTPKAEGRFVARLRILFVRANGSPGFQNHILTGVGEDCATPPPAAPPPAPVPAPPAPGPAPVCVCIKFYYLTAGGGAGAPAAAAINSLVAGANRIWAGTGIKFEREGAAGAGPEVVTEIQPKDKVHCLAVYFVDAGSPHIDAGAAGNTRVTVPGTTRRNWKNEVLDEIPGGTSGPFVSNVGYGTCIFIFVGAHPQTLAHELGHALGLAPGTDADENAHLDPDTGASIPNGSGRLMQPRGGPADTTITDREKAIARIVAKFLIGQFEPCDETGIRIGVPGSPIFRRGVLTNLGNRIRVRAFLRRPLAEIPPFLLRLEIDLQRNRRADRFIQYQWNGRAFAVSHSRVETRTPIIEPDFHANRATREGPRINTRLEFSIPTDFMTTSRKRAGFRIFIIPANASPRRKARIQRRARFRRLHLRSPMLIVDVNRSSRVLRGRSGSRVLVRGRIIRSRTMRGRVDLYLQLGARGSNRLIPMGALRKRGGSWSRRVRLPREMKPGKYRAYLKAKCVACKVETSLNMILLVKPGAKAKKPSWPRRKRPRRDPAKPGGY